MGWTSYNYPTSLTTATESVSYSYGPDRQPWRETYTSSSGTETTYRAGKLFEVAYYAEPNLGVLAHYRHYVYAGNELVSIDDRSTAAAPLYYVVSDHQGSYSSIETGANPGTNFVSESFTPFGNRRSGESWSGAPGADESNINIVSRRGFTDESTLGVSMGLNHLNGRVEDSITGRFISADPQGIIPGNTQSFDRYSYVVNNPLSFTDPSGFDETDICTESCGVGGGTSPSFGAVDQLPGLTVTGLRGGWQSVANNSVGAFNPNPASSSSSNGGDLLDPFTVIGKKPAPIKSNVPPLLLPFYPSFGQTNFGFPDGGDRSAQSPHAESACENLGEIAAGTLAGAAAGAAGGAVAGTEIAPGVGSAALAAAGAVGGAITGLVTSAISVGGAPAAFIGAVGVSTGYVTSAFAGEAFAGGATLEGALAGAGGGALSGLPGVLGAAVGGAAGAYVPAAGIAVAAPIVAGGIDGGATYLAVKAVAASICGQ